MPGSRRSTTGRSAPTRFRDEPRGRARPSWPGSACRCSSSRRGSARRSGSPRGRGPSRAAGGARDARSSTTRWRSSRRPPAGLEVECSVIGNDDPIASQPGEIVLAAGESGWYDYEAKYTPGRDAADRPRPDPRAASASGCASSRSRRSSARAAAGWRGSTSSSTASGCSSTSSTRCRASPDERVRALFAASGVRYAELLDRLVELAFERHDASRRYRH